MFALRVSEAGYHELRFVAAESEGAAGPTHPRGPAAAAAARVAVNPAYTFERFVIGPGNRVAHGAALVVAEAPGEAYNPLFLHGPPGLGKTHLLGAIANYLSEHTPELTVHYTTAEAFTNEFVSALQTRGVERFKQRYRRYDVLLIDDVQFLEGKSHTADEFFHTFNALHDAGAQIILSADRLPLQLSALAERLRQRFQWGLTVELEPPDLLTRRAVLRRLVVDRENQVDEEVVTEIAARAPNLRVLEGALTRVVALSSLTASPLTPELVSRALPNETTFPRQRRPDVERIQEEVAARLDLTRADLLSPSRASHVTQARQLAMHLTRELTDLSLPAIAATFHRRDHTTVIHALRQVSRRLQSDQALAELTATLANDLTSNASDSDRS
jgi:chromosomal replication initiator protein